MNKSILYAAILFFVIIMGFGFKKQQPFDVTKLSANVIECLPTNNFNEDAISFALDPNEVTLIRKDITTLTPNELASFRSAITKMKKDKISFLDDDNNNTTMSIWDFQTAIHGELDDSNARINKDFRQCKHRSKYFLAWHRMYIYFFERILHSYMPNSPTLGLPYWDYQTCSKIPDSVRVNKIKSTKKDNTLYDDTREGTLASGGYLPEYDITKNNFKNSKIYKTIEAALDITEFYDFQKKLEVPHGAIHRTVGGNLATYASPLDPLFWLNHANVDRLWEKWLTQKGGRCNPTNETDKNWWDKTFYFYNEKKVRVAMQSSQIVDIANQLHYTYDNVISATSNPRTCNKLNLLAYATPTNLQKKNSINNAIIDNNSDNEYEFASVANNSNPNSSLGLMPSNTNNNPWPNFFKNDYYLEFEQIKVISMPAGIIEIYLIDKRDTSFIPSDKNFVGLFDLFTALSVAGSGSNHNHNFDDGQDAVFRISINEAIKKIFSNATSTVSTSGIKLPKLSSASIKNTFEDVKNMRIHFLIRGNILNGVEVKKNVSITIGKLSLAAYKK
jgi:Common central domain of tyrosinase/Polyphenol oxidase middle domain